VNIHRSNLNIYQVIFMSEKYTDDSQEAKIQTLSSIDAEAKHNLVGFFALLIKVDKRLNPHLYKRVKSKDVIKKVTDYA